MAWNFYPITGCFCQNNYLGGGFIVVISFMVAMGAKRSRTEKGSVTVTKLNEEFEDLADALRVELLDEKSFKEEKKVEKKTVRNRKKNRAKRKSQPIPARKKLKTRFVVDFDGDIKASAAEGLRHTVTSILSQARPQDEVVVRLESQGVWCTATVLHPAS